MGQEQTPTAQLFLVLDTAGTKLPVDRLETVLAEKRIACLLLSTQAQQPASDGNLQAIVAMAQRNGVAVLISNDETLAKELSADGVHLSPDEEPPGDRYARARAVLGNDLIVGADAGGSRHDAMALAEAGADYIAFGVPGGLPDQETARERQRELVAWWAEIFEPPVVALDIVDHQQSQEFASTGADFIARTLPVGLAAAELKQWLTAAHQALATAVHSD
jgi:thiamine-phosphate pyrophosphorylase